MSFVKVGNGFCGFNELIMLAAGVLNFSRFYHKVSRLFQPINVALKLKSIPASGEKDVNISHKLLENYGYIKSRGNGMYAFLPLGMRVLKKIENLIEKEMISLGAQRVNLPFLTSGSLWKTTGRWDSVGTELMTIKDRNDRDYVLSPTHEEAITDLISNVHAFSYKSLPLKLYQINFKFRDEMRQKSGLLRTKEFIMKDLYCFDANKEDSICTYNEVVSAYERFFKALQIPFVKVRGAVGTIGGSISHEFHIPSEEGEDKICVCKNCGYACNVEIHEGSLICPSCSDMLESLKAIEVGHTFLLGTTYSDPLKATYLNNDTKSKTLYMSCFGIGLSRLMAAVVASLGNKEEIKWPKSIAPFSYCIIPPKAGSKEFPAMSWVEYIAQHLQNISYDEVIIDDRINTTIGKRLLEAKRCGYPYCIVIGKKSFEPVPLFEFIDNLQDKSNYFSFIELCNYLKSL